MSQRNNPTFTSSIFNNQQNQKSQRIASPHRPNDQPITSFYQVDEQDFKINQARQKVEVKQHQYNIDKNKTLTLNNQQRRQYDNTSEIFGPRNNDYNQERINNNNNNNNIATKTQWNDVGSSKCAVNEFANFTQEYAKNKKYFELFSDNNSQTNRKVNTEQNYEEYDNLNEDIKKKNQQFSNIFGKEFGEKGKVIKKQEHRSLSPQINWNDFDCIRNMHDQAKEEKQTVLKYYDGQKSQFDHHNYEGQKVDSIVKNDTNCKASLAKIKGEYKQAYQGFRESLQLREEWKMKNTRSQNQGVYVWKKYKQK